VTLVIPAVDISGGRCVRLFKGRIGDATIYYDDPLDAARKWEAEGAEIIHVVDLDAATGTGDNSQAVIKVIKGVKTPVEVGGGIRTIEKASGYINAGAARVIFGTAALEMKVITAALGAFGSEKVMAAVDHLMGRVAVRGWQEMTDIDAMVLCTRLEEVGVRNIMMTAIDRDGTLKGPNLMYSLNAAQRLKSSIYLAGGFSKLNDLLLVKGTRIAGVIIGKALYEGVIDFKKAREVLR